MTIPRQRNFLAGGDLVVVETDEDAFLGSAEILEGFIAIRSGFVGRPAMIPLELVRQITPAIEHPDVDGLAPRE